MFPKNAWYVACMPDEIDSKPLGRKICGESMVLYRGPENKATACLLYTSPSPRD